MTMEEAQELPFDEPELTSSFIIELLNLCDSVVQLNKFHEEVDLLFAGDEGHVDFTKFEKEVVYEHFHKKLDSLIAQNKNKNS